MSHANPRVSIGIPVFNGGPFLREAISSLLEQTFADFELIISDNASTDETPEICRELCQQDARIRYERVPENCGAIENFNRLVGLSRGEYFKWAAADDVCLPQFLEALVPILADDPGVVWCHSQTGKIDEDGRVLAADDPLGEGLVHSTAAGMPRTDHDSPRPHRRFRGVLLGTAWCADCYGLIRTDVLRRTRLLPKCYGAEKVLIGELALHGRYREHPETLFLHRVHRRASGNLATSGQQQRYMLGKLYRAKWNFSRWVLLRHHLEVVRRAPLGIQDRLRSYLAVGAYVFQVHKWWHVASSVVLNKPLKGYSPPVQKVSRGEACTEQLAGPRR